VGYRGFSPCRRQFLGGTIQESPIFIKTYDFTKWLLEHTIRFLKSQRFVMGKRIEEAALDFYDCLLLAVKIEKDRKETLQRASFELERLKHYLRLSKDLELFSLRQYEYSSTAVVEIGRLLLTDSLKYCQDNKGLQIYHFVFMLNHMHLIAGSREMIGFIRDFKTFTSKEIKKNIRETEPQILKLFQDDEEYHFWQKTNMPEVIRSEDFYLEKAQYVE